MQRPQTLLAALVLGITFAPHSGATVYQFDGSDANVQSLNAVASDGDVITLPAGTFIWTAGVSLTKGLTIRGQTTVTGAGTANCSANDQTIIIDEKLRGTPGSLLKATIPAGKSFRLTGITFRRGTVNIVGQDGAIRVDSSGGLVQSARIDHCHFYQLAWDAMLQIMGWTYGVDDHNLFEQGDGTNHSHFITNGSTNGHNEGNGAWADFPYYGSGKFWFMEDNTIKGKGGPNGGIIGLAVADMPPDTITGRMRYRMATARKAGLCAACAPLRFTATLSFGQARLVGHSGPAAAFGMTTLFWVETPRMATIPRSLTSGNMALLAVR